MAPRDRLVEEARRILQQGIDLVAGLDDELYRHVEAGVTTSSVGGHIRHCIDHVACFLRGLEEGRIDYDRRERDPRIETDREHAIAGLRRVCEGLARISPARDYGTLAVRTDHDRADETASDSSLERELQALISHTVHHFALIAFIVRLNGHRTAEGFGVARSTLAYWRDREPPGARDREPPGARDREPSGACDREPSGAGTPAP